MKKIFFLSFLLLSTLNASYLLDSRNVCIDDFYFKNGTFYFLKSSDSSWYSTHQTMNMSSIQQGFLYDANTSTCVHTAYLELGMNVQDFNFLLGLVGVLIGFVILEILVYAFMRVGGKS